MTYSNDRLEGVAGRIDKVDFLFLCEYDRWQAEQQSMLHLFDYVEQTYGESVGFRVQCFGADKESGLRRYGISTWGAACDKLLQVLPAHYHSQISRLDFRIEAEISPNQIARLKGHLDEHNPRGRNVIDYTGRKRNKEFARNSGGRGVAFGSHKSDIRLTSYKRSGETGAVELQVSGKRVRHIVDISSQTTKQPNGGSFYGMVCDYMVAYFHGLVNEADFASIPDFLQFVEQSDYTMTHTDYTEMKNAELEAHFLQLPHEVQLDFIDRLNIAINSPFFKLA